MCGICGIWGKLDRTTIERMTCAMVHRGPDDSGIYLDDAVGLGMRRLSILDLSPAGHQPMSTDDGKLWIVYNGEIYNFREEKSALEARGHRFRSQSDTEVILHLYQVYGPDCVHRLRGMFAFAIWDAERQKLFLARDRLGIKPLYYAWVGSSFIFASELKAMLASGLIERRLDPEAVRLYLTFGCVYPPHTMVAGVKALLPGYRLILSAAGDERVEEYWDLPKSSPRQTSLVDYPEAAGHLRALLSESVRMRLISDVPLGAFLSGGVDSSAIVGLMSETSATPVKTFSIGFDAAGRAIDESNEAAQSARHFGSDHTHLVITGQDVASDWEQIITALDQPSIDGVNSYLVSKAARQQVTVALSGLGGDELFAGYGTFSRMTFEDAERQKKLLRGAWNEALAWGASQPVWGSLLRTPFGKYIDAARSSAGFLNRYAISRRVFSTSEQIALLSDGFARTVNLGILAQDVLSPFDDSSLESAVSRVGRLELKTYMPFQLLRDMDAMSMAHSLEVRVPLIDHKLVEFVFALPSEYKLGSSPSLGSWNERTSSYSQSKSKRILFDAVRDLLPPGMENRTKSGFGLPFSQWLKTDLKSAVSDILSPMSLAKNNIFRPEATQNLVEAFEAGHVSWSAVWSVVVLEEWCRLVLNADSQLPVLSTPVEAL